MDNKRFFLNIASRPASATITFYTNKTGTFSPTVATTDMSSVTWYVGSQVPQYSNTPVFQGLVGDLLPVRMVLSNDDSLLSLDLSASGIFGDVLLSNSTLLEYLDLSGNPDLIKVITNSQSAVGVYVNISNSGIQIFENTGLMSGFIANNTQLTSIVNLVTGAVSGPINLQDVTTISTVDLTNYVVSGVLNLKNSTITSIVALTTNGATIYDLYNSGLTTNLPSLRILDLFDARGTGLTALSITSINSGATINFHDRNLTSAQVNAILFSVDSSGLVSGVVDLAGTNSYVDSFSGGYNGFALANSIAGKSNDVFINYASMDLIAASTGSYTLNVTTQDSSPVDILVNGDLKSSGVGNRTFTATAGNTITLRPQKPSMFRTFSNTAGALSGVADFSQFNMTSVVFTACPLLSGVKFNYTLTGSTLYLTLNNTGVGYVDLSGIVATNNIVVALTDCSNLTTFTSAIPTNFTANNCLLLDEINIITNTVFSVTDCKASSLSLSGTVATSIELHNTELAVIDLANVSACSHLEISGSPNLYAVSNLPSGTYDVDLSGAELLTSFTFPAGATILSELNLQSCRLSSLSIIGSIMPGSDIRLNDNLLSTANVNVFLDELNNASLSGCNIYIGGTNAAPDNSSGGIDGLDMISQLIADSNTVDYVEPIAVMTLTTVKQGVVQVTFDSPAAGISWSTSNGYSGTGNISFTNAVASTQITVTFTDPTLVTKFVAVYQGLSGTVDLSRLTNLTTIDISNNQYLSTITGLKSAVVAYLDVSSTGITSLNLTQLAFSLNAELMVIDVPGLTSLQFSTQTQSIDFTISNTGLTALSLNNISIASTGVIENAPIDTITGLKGTDVNLEIVDTSISSLTLSNIINPTSLLITHNLSLATIVGLSGSSTDLFLYNNNITGVLDLTNITINQYADLSNNPLLSQIISLSGTAVKEVVLDNCTSLTACDLTSVIFNGSNLEPALLSAVNCTSLIDLGEVIGVMCNVDISNSSLTSINVSDVTTHSSFIADGTGLTVLPDPEIDIASTATIRTLSIQNADLSGIITVGSRFTDILLNDNIGITQLNLDFVEESPTNVDVSNTSLTTLDHATTKILGTFNFSNTSISTINGTGADGGYTMVFGTSIPSIAGMNNIMYQLSLTTTEPSTLDFTGATGALDTTSGGKNGVAAYDTMKALGCTIIEAGPSYIFTIGGAGTITPVIEYTYSGPSSKWVVGATTYNGNSPSIPVQVGWTVTLISYDHLNVKSLDVSNCLLSGVVDVLAMQIHDQITVSDNPMLTRLYVDDSLPIAIYAANTGIDELLESYYVKDILYLESSTALVDCTPSITTDGPISYVMTDSMASTVDLSGIDVRYLDLSRNINLTIVNMLGTINNEPMTIILQACDSLAVFDSSDDIQYIDISDSTLLGPGTTLASSPRSIKARNAGLTGTFIGFGALSQIIADGGILDVSLNSITTLNLSYQSTAALELIANANSMTSLLKPALPTGLKIVRGIDVSNNLLTTLGVISSDGAIYIKVNNNSINGVVDLSQVTAAKDFLHLHSQPSITALTLPTYVYSGTDINVSSALDTAALVNKFLVDLVTRSITGCTINIGGSNPAPDASSGGYDGLAAKTTLELTNTFV